MPKSIRSVIDKYTATASDTKNVIKFMHMEKSVLLLSKPSQKVYRKQEEQSLQKFETETKPLADEANRLRRSLKNTGDDLKKRMKILNKFRDNSAPAWDKHAQRMLESFDKLFSREST